MLCFTQELLIIAEELVPLHSLTQVEPPHKRLGRQVEEALHLEMRR